ncbi:MAG: TlpA family protein disulfide reductase [Rubrivivax sp.]|nr:TlpA family protein disulfide reductase [Rubrivivax sp.]
MNASISDLLVVRALRAGLALWAAFWLAALPPPAKALVVGETLATRWLESAQGPQPLIAGQARLTYVDFWASWCGPCKQSFPWMNDMHAKFAGSGLRILAVNVDAKRADAERFLQGTPAHFAVVYDRDGAFAKTVDVKTMPTSMLLDAQGRVLFVHQGFTAKDRESLEAVIAGALRDGKVAARP